MSKTRENQCNPHVTILQKSPHSAPNTTRFNVYAGSESIRPSLETSSINVYSPVRSPVVNNSSVHHFQSGGQQTLQYPIINTQTPYPPVHSTVPLHPTVAIQPPYLPCPSSVPIPPMQLPPSFQTTPLHPPLPPFTQAAVPPSMQAQTSEHGIVYRLQVPSVQYQQRPVSDHAAQYCQVTGPVYQPF